MKAVTFLAVFLAAAVPSVSSADFRFVRDSGERTYQPTLLYPTTNDISLEGKDSLVFRWEEADRINTDHYELRLFKDYDTTASGLIMKMDADRSPAKIPSTVFEEGRSYTWSLRQILRSGRRGDYSYSSFKVIKK